MNTLLQQSHQRIRLRRVSDEEVSIAQHVSHDTAVDDRPSWRAADLGAAGYPETLQSHKLRNDTT